ncbi:MAG: hypothetical protein HC869_25085 [Rhodospirillales bacterium]|nr:hypothetical protein [Rhodospirillales bacterium]
MPIITSLALTGGKSRRYEIHDRQVDLRLAQPPQLTAQRHDPPRETDRSQKKARRSHRSQSRSEGHGRG